MPFQIVRNDITKMNTQAVVNCANEYLMPTGGVSSAIFNAAGMDYVSADCRRIGKCKTGMSVITRGYNLCPYIIHTAGPVWHGGLRGEKRKLKSCYESALQLAFDNGITSIAFPLISAGSFGFPKKQAIDIATQVIGSSPYLADIDVYLCLFDDDAVTIAAKYQRVKAYIDNNYVSEHFISCRPVSASFEECDTVNDAGQSARFCPPASTQQMQSAPVQYQPYIPMHSIEDMLKTVDESFSRSLLRLIDEKGLKDSDVYKKANIDRKLFSKIRNNVDYRPKKNTVIAFAIALELNISETNALLGKAGYILSHSSKADIIIEFFIKNRNYNIFEINEALFAFDQSLLGV